jgi:hypothetical protein
MNELPAPPDVTGDAEAAELLRVWIVREALQCSLQADAFPDPGSWGAVLADVARYVARARREQESIPEEQTIQKILDVFHEEIRSPAAE